MRERAREERHLSASFINFLDCPQTLIFMRSTETCCVDSKKMKALTSVADISKTGSWICRNCLRGRRRHPFQCATYATRPTTAPTAKPFESKSYAYKDTKEKVTSSEASLARSPSAHSPTSSNTNANRRNLAIVLAALLAAGSFLASSDTARHSYAAVTRSMRVLYALGRSVREWVFVNT